MKVLNLLLKNPVEKIILSIIIVVIIILTFRYVRKINTLKKNPESSTPAVMPKPVTPAVIPNPVTAGVIPESSTPAVMPSLGYTTDQPYNDWIKTNYVGQGGGTKNFSYKCPPTTYIDKIKLNAGAGLDKIGIRCKGQSDNDIIHHGGNGGNPYVYDNISEDEKYVVSGGKYVGNITPFNIYKQNGINRSAGASVGSWGGDNKIAECPENYRISGVYGTHGMFMDSLGFWCQKVQ